jgi:glycosyltransferase involved in cell wall biosynthesis
VLEDKMKIAAVQETYPPFIGGSSYRAHEIFKRLVKDGHEVDVYTARLSPNLKPFEIIDGVNVYRIQTPGGLLKQGGEFRNIPDVLRFATAVFWRLLVNDKHYDVYEVNHSPLIPVFVVELVSRIKNIPVSVTFHEVWKELWFNYIKNKAICHTGIILERLTTRAGNHLIAVSRVTGERLKTCFGVPADRFTVISNGVDLSAFEHISCDKIPYKIIYLGRLNKHKNVDLLIKAFQYIRNKIPDATLDIVGDGPERQNLEALSSGIPGIIFHGAVSEEQKAELLSSAWLYVLPSVREGQGISLLEAMAARTPTIAAFYEGSGVVSVIRHAENGLLAKPDPEHIANAVLKYYASPELYTHVQEEGLRFVQTLDWNSIALKHENLYRSMIGEKTSPVPDWGALSDERAMDNALK